jgi:hypothetical protein
MSAHDTKTLNAEDVVLPDATYAKLRNIAFAAVVVGGGLTAFGAASEKSNFFFSYLIGFMFWLSVSLGSMFFVLIQYLTRAGWAVVVRRTAEAFASVVPYFLILFVPIAFGMHDLFSWTHEGHVSASKAKYLNTTFFLIRAGLYFVIWTWISWRLSSLSVDQDKTGNEDNTRKLAGFAPGATILFALTISFAGFDWVMSLQPHWFSTIFGVYIFAGAAVASFAMLSLSMIGMSKLKGLEGKIHAEHLHSLGKFLFGFTIFWAYIAFSQFMLIWYANIPEETEFFQHRFHHGWEWPSAALLIGHFVIAFLMLLPRASKRIPTLLAFGAFWQLAFHWLDLFWLIAPHKKEVPGGEEFAHFHITAGDIGAWVLLGGIFGVLALRKLKAHALVPVKDPRLSESLAAWN